MKAHSLNTARGFTLIEIAIVLVIITVLLTIVAIPLAGQLEQRRVNETNKQLELIKETIIGYALANGRFPCPATDGLFFGASTSNGAENIPVTGGCAVKVGYVPAVTLGLAPVDDQGFALDAWAVPGNSTTRGNKIIYAIADINIAGPTTITCPNTIDHPLSTISGMKVASMDCLASKTLITVCSSTPVGGSPGAATGCTAGTLLTDKAPFVLISLGKNAAIGAAPGTDEAHNVDGKLITNQDLIFVSHSLTASGGPGGEFDDMVTWASLNTIFGRMVQAGKLP